MDPRVLDRMLPFFAEQFGNPHSRTHAYGWEAETAVDEARHHIADLVGAQSKDIVFTSGATESNNMLIKGIAKFHQAKRRHLITTQTVSVIFQTVPTRNLTRYPRRSINASLTRAAIFQHKVSTSPTSQFFPMVSSRYPISEPLFGQTPRSSPS